VDRETVNNESKENQKQKKFKNSRHSLGLDHHTFEYYLIGVEIFPIGESNDWTTTIKG
jgi:hypothetical protein